MGTLSLMLPRVFRLRPPDTGGLYPTDRGRIMRKLVRHTVLAAGLLMTFAIFYGLCADDERHGERHRHTGGTHDDIKGKHGRNHEAHLGAVTNKTYAEKCGVCHFAYQPGLLPSGSWAKILSNLKDHFGETVDIDAASKEVIAKYLMNNAAENSQAKRSRKILKSLREATPSRITEIPYIRHKHQDLSPEVFARKAVGSLSNCLACHKTADQGIYEDDNVVIPK